LSMWDVCPIGELHAAQDLPESYHYGSLSAACYMSG
jgi:hypothetical protein